MNGKRHRERRETLVYWPAEEAGKGKAVGLVTNISEEGLHIHSQHALQKGRMFTLRITVDPRLAGTQHISLVVKNVWCRASGVPGLYHAGFKIVDISDRARRGIRNLMAAFSYPAPEEKMTQSPQTTRAAGNRV